MTFGEFATTYQSAAGVHTGWKKPYYIKNKNQDANRQV
jgi:hypothetical protein